MKYKNFSAIILITSFCSLASAENEIFVNGFEMAPVVLTKFNLNDTGIDWAQNSPPSGSMTCVSNISADQDCHQGRDADPRTNSNADGHAGFSFTKLDINGNPLSSNATSWACVKDNVTQLVWEVKTDSAGVHNRGNVYQWGGLTAIGREHPGRKGTYFDPSWNSLVTNSNDNNFCGFSNWRLPTVAELTSILNHSRQVRFSSIPTIDMDYFPNTMGSGYWTASPHLGGEGTIARMVSFNTGRDLFSLRSDSRLVRLVRTDP
ncbi:MAG: DUF1566 domain-containing protein [Xanthomonadales bacterium]|nr:DUF1566 domain-containing protein [Xanthomonadales bacterium]